MKEELTPETTLKLRLACMCEGAHKASSKILANDFKNTFLQWINCYGKNVSSAEIEHVMDYTRSGFVLCLSSAKELQASCLSSQNAILIRDCLVSLYGWSISTTSTTGDDHFDLSKIIAEKSIQKYAEHTLGGMKFVPYEMMQQIVDDIECITSSFEMPIKHTLQEQESYAA